MIRLVCFLILLTTGVSADVLVAVRTIPAQSVISVEDLQRRDFGSRGALSDLNEVVGKEARVTLFAGRPIHASDVGVPAVVERNQVIPLIYDGAGILIKTEGRALDRAGPGEFIRVMNMQSRTTVTARIDATGAARVTP